MRQLVPILTVWLLLSPFCVAGEVNHEVAERESLTRPKILVPLLYGSKYAPVLGTLVGNTLYYSNVRARGRCVGEGLIALDIRDGERKEIELPVKLPCVVSLHTDSAALYVYGGENEKALNLFRLVEGALQPALEGAAPWSAGMLWRRMQIEEKTQVPWFTQQAIPISLSVLSPEQVSVTMALPADRSARLTFSITPSPDKKKPLIGVAPIEVPKGFQPLNNVSHDSHGRYYMTAKTDQNAIRVLVWTDPSKAPVAIGGDYPFEGDEWLEADVEGKDSVLLRDPIISTARYGVLIHDRTEFANELNSILYYGPAEAKLHRVQISTNLLEGVEGVSLCRGGLLITQKKDRMIFWAGTTSPFDTRMFPPRNTRLQIIRNSTAQKTDEKGK